MSSEIDARFVRKDVVLDGAETHADGAQDALLDQFVERVDKLAGAFCGQLEIAQQLLAFDTDVFPCADWLSVIVTEKSNWVLLEVLDLPTVCADHVAVSVFVLCGHDEGERRVLRLLACLDDRVHGFVLCYNARSRHSIWEVVGYGDPLCVVRWVELGKNVMS